ncbi:MAG: tRNA(His) guanylyltransferase Thg1 family protein [Patescibacteria group bacterium]|nr:tRNA(His) guanylyltransferase Thg1 family protein [Patescibacteria group bacterium]
MSKRPDEHGDRMKGYEAEFDRKLDVHLPIYVRLDGRAFSRFTNGLERPFDPAMSAAMRETLCGLIGHTHARIGYTQSDEISLIYLAEGEDSDVLFSGRLQKMTSILASLATALFTRAILASYSEALKSRLPKLPHFDCRVCQMPSKTEAANMMLWRYKDAIKNSIQMVAQDNFSPRQLHGKHGGEMLEMLKGVGVDYFSLPVFFRTGTFARRVTELRGLTSDELARIPEKFRPIGPILRSSACCFEIEDFQRALNREQVIFDAAEPVIERASAA